MVVFYSSLAYNTPTISEIYRDFNFILYRSFCVLLGFAVVFRESYERIHCSVSLRGQYEFLQASLIILSRESIGRVASSTSIAVRFLPITSFVEFSSRASVLSSSIRASICACVFTLYFYELITLPPLLFFFGREPLPFCTSSRIEFLP